MLRGPKLIQMCPVGDFERWLWVMETERGHIFGKAFRINYTDLLVMTPDELAKVKQDAYDEMIARSAQGGVFAIPEGSYWDAFL